MSIATLAGVPLTAMSEVSWPLSEGVRPQQRIYETDTPGAMRIMQAAGRPAELVLSTGGYEAVRVQQVHILSTRPGSRPDTTGILVADRRWLWPHKTITRDLNERRRTGETRLVGEGNVRVENQSVVADAAYAPATLNNGVPWTAEAALRSVLTELVGSEFAIEPVRRQIAIENLVLAHPADMALEILLHYCGGLGITVDPSGLVRVYDRRSGGEVPELIAAGPALQEAGYPGFVDRRYSRPRSIKAYFERECELRFDYLEDSPVTTTIRGEEPRRLENVMPCPDSTLTMNGKTVTQGTLRTVDDFLTAWVGSQRAFAVSPLSQSLIREYYFHWSNLVTKYLGDNEITYSAVWQRRLNAIRNHWRKTFRILPAWRDRIRSIKAIRAAIVDVENGTPAKAMAWLDYVAFPSYLSLENTYTPRTKHLGRNVSNYATTLQAAFASPASVTVTDDQAAVVRVVLQTDPFGESEEMLPGNADKLPLATCVDTRQLGDRRALIQACKLVSGFKLAVILTAIQAGPNNLGRYHVETVTPSNAEGVLGAPIGPCDGPEWSVLISGNTATARFAWSDALSTQIDAAFYRGEPYPRSLLVNGAQIRNVALAEAARQYATMLDRTEGSFVVALNAGLRVRGAISTIEHRISTDGLASTLIAIDPEIEPLDMHAVLPQGDQRALRKMVGL